MNGSALRWLVVLAILSPAVHLQEPPAPTEDQTFARCLAEFKVVRTSLTAYSFTKHITAERHEKNGKVAHHEEREYGYVPRPDGRFDIRLLTVNGAPPTEKELKEHEKQMNKEFSKSPEQVAEDKKKAEEEDTSISEDFFDYFDFKPAGRDQWNGKAAFLLDFSPKAEIAELKDKNKKLLRSMAGRAWVSEGEFRLLCVEMHNVKSVKIWGGLSGVDHFSVRTEYIPAASGPYLPKSETSQWGLHVGFSNLGTFSRAEEYSNFQKVEVKPAADKPPPTT